MLQNIKTILVYRLCKTRQQARFNAQAIVGQALVWKIKDEVIAKSVVIGRNGKKLGSEDT